MISAPAPVTPSRIRRRDRRAANHAASEPVRRVLDPEVALRLALAEAFDRVVPTATRLDRTAGRCTFAALAYSRTAVAAGPTSLSAEDAARVRREVIDELVDRALGG